jgi:dTDP-4-dehydrorhamnose reductase
VAGDYPEADVTDVDALRRFLAGSQPEVIFNCAAITDVDGCESKPEAAFAVNGTGAGNVAAVASELGAVVIHVSTDFVFDGRKSSPYLETDLPAPLSAYGGSKLEGERQVAARAREWVIARTAWLYGRRRMNFVDRMLQLGRQKEELVVVTDQVGSPTWTRDLAEAMVVLVRSDSRGIYHVANAGACSRYEQVQYLFRCVGLPTRVTPGTSASFPRVAPVPAYSPLSTGKLRRETGHSMRSWQEALREYAMTESPQRPGGAA